MVASNIPKRKIKYQGRRRTPSPQDPKQIKKKRGPLQKKPSFICKMTFGPTRKDSIVSLLPTNIVV